MWTWRWFGSRACHRINPAVSVHGMRSTFRDSVADATKFPRELAELAIAHAFKGEAGLRQPVATDRRSW
jgi:hypothetical protein